MKPNICPSTLSKVFVGSLAIIVAIVIFVAGRSKGIFINAEGTEAYMRATMMSIFGCGLILAPYYQKKSGGWTSQELFLYIALMLSVEIVPRIISIYY